MQDLLGSSAAGLKAQALMSIACLPMRAERLPYYCSVVTKGPDFWDCSGVALDGLAIF